MEIQKRGLSLNQPTAPPLIDDDAVHWMLVHFRVPETPNHRLKLHAYQRLSLKEALSVSDDGLFRYSTILWSDVKKSIKSTLAAAVVLWRAFQVEWGSVYIIANDLKQADSRVFYYIRRAIELNPYLKNTVKIANYKITLPNKTFIEAIPIDPTGEAGGNADMIVFSELWGAHQKAQEKMWTEQTLSPTKFGKSFRWIETYAGFTNESPLLERLYETGVKHGAQFEWAKTKIDPPLEAFRNEPARMFSLWNTQPRLSWQTKEYYAQESATLLESEFNRVHRNQWASSSQTFIPSEWWEACREAGPALGLNESCIIAMDAAVSGDCFGILMLSGRGDGQYDVRYSRAWKPPKGGKLDFGGEDGPEKELRRLIDLYNVIEVAYDPYQLEDMASRLTNELISTFYAFAQGQERAVADKSLRDMIRDRRVHHTGDYDLSEHIQNANMETSGEKLRLTKKNDNLKIDLAVCLSMAAARSSYWGL